MYLLVASDWLAVPARPIPNGCSPGIHVGTGRQLVSCLLRIARRSTTDRRCEVSIAQYNDFLLRWSDTYKNYTAP